MNKGHLLDVASSFVQDGIIIKDREGDEGIPVTEAKLNELKERGNLAIQTKGNIELINFDETLLARIIQ